MERVGLIQPGQEESRREMQDVVLGQEVMNWGGYFSTPARPKVEVGYRSVDGWIIDVIGLMSWWWTLVYLGNKLATLVLIGINDYFLLNWRLSISHVCCLHSPWWVRFRKEGGLRGEVGSPPLGFRRDRFPPWDVSNSLVMADTMLG